MASNVAGSSSDTCFTQLREQHDREYPELSKVPNRIRILANQWQRKSELLNNPEIQKQLKPEDMDRYKKEVRNETAKMQASKQQAGHLLDALKAGTSTVSKKIDLFSDWKPKNYDHHLYALGNLQSKRDTMQMLCHSMTAEIRHAKEIGQKILAAEVLPPPLIDDQKAPIDEQISGDEPSGLKDDDSWEYLDKSEPSGLKNEDDWEKPFSY